MRMIVPACAAMLLCGMTAGAWADEVQVLGSNNTIFRLDTETGAITKYHEITGLVANERVLSIETGQFSRLFGITKSRIYEINPTNGVATPLAPRFASLWGDYDDYYDSHEPAGFTITPGATAADVFVTTATYESGGISVTGHTSVRRRLDFATMRLSGPDVLVYPNGEDSYKSPADVVTGLYVDDPAATQEPTLLALDAEGNAFVRIGTERPDPTTPELIAVTSVVPLTGLASGQRAVSLARSSEGHTILLTAFDAQGWYWGPKSLYTVDLPTGVATKVRDFATNEGGSLAIELASPAGWRPEPAIALDVAKASVEYDPRRPAQSSVKLVGKIEVEAWNGQTLRVDVGGIVREFTLDARGRGESGRDSFRISSRPKNGSWQYTIVLRGREVEKLGVQAVGGTAGVVADLFLGADPMGMGVKAYRAAFELDYFRNRSGRAIGSKHIP